MHELTVTYRMALQRSAKGAAAEADLPAAKPRHEPPEPRVPRAARLLALAHHIDRLIEGGRLRDYADAARRLGVTRARLTQVMNLLLLSPALQEAILVTDRAPSERTLRRLVRVADWQLQLPPFAEAPC